MVIYQFSKLQPLLDIYKISPAIGRVTPRFAWIVLRVGGFLIFELQLNYKNRSLYQELSLCSTPKEAFEYLYKSSIIKSLLRDKAARMFLSWIGHPDLGIDVSQGKWKKSDFLMPVDGHVGKVFARTGMLNEIHRESSRKDIIEALRMRDDIQSLVVKKDFDPVMVDHGAFILGYWCCSDQQENASCLACFKVTNCEIKELIECDGICPLTKFCRKNMRWRAY